MLGLRFSVWVSQVGRARAQDVLGAQGVTMERGFARYTQYIANSNTVKILWKLSYKLVSLAPASSRQRCPEIWWEMGVNDAQSGVISHSHIVDGRADLHPRGITIGHAPDGLHVVCPV